MNNISITKTVDNKFLSIMKNYMGESASAYYSYFGLGQNLPTNPNVPILWFRRRDSTVKRVGLDRILYITYDVYLIDNVGDTNTGSDMNAVLDDFEANYQSYLEFSFDRKIINLVAGKYALMSGMIVEMNTTQFSTEGDCCDVLNIEGDTGPQGQTGESAYQAWLDLGNTGTEQDFIDSLKGDDGESAYQVWLDLGNVGTEQDFIDSLKGASDWGDITNTPTTLSGYGITDAYPLIGNPSGFISTINGINAGGELSGTYPNPTLLNSAVIAKVLTGLNITGGTVLSTDSILSAFGKVQNQLNGLIGGTVYKGTWNASTNTPSLTSGVGTDGNYYIVSVAGSTNLDGITDWNLGDWAIFHGGVWQKVDNTDSVVSVNGFTGAVNLTTANIPEVTNLYYTNGRVKIYGDTQWSLLSHTHTTSDITNLSSYTGFDSRYYTQSQVNTLLSGKADTVHTHAASDVVSGIFATARLGSGTANSSTFLRGDGTWATASSISGLTTNRLTKATSSTTIGDSKFYDDGTYTAIGGAPTVGVTFSIFDATGYSLEFIPGFTGVNFIQSYDRANSAYRTLKMSALSYQFQNSGSTNVEILSSGRLKLYNVPDYATNAAALLGGLTVGEVYKLTGTGQLMIVI